MEVSFYNIHDYEHKQRHYISLDIQQTMQITQHAVGIFVIKLALAPEYFPLLLYRLFHVRDSYFRCWAPIPLSPLLPSPSP